MWYKQISQGILKYYNWILAAMAFIMIFCSLGLANSTNGLYVAFVTEDMGFSRGMFSVVISLRYIFTSVVNAGYGPINKHLGVRRMVGIGFLLLAVTFMAFSLAQNIIMFYIFGVVWGVAIAFSSTAVASQLVRDWFTSHRGLVLGVVLAGSGIGGAVFYMLVENWISHFGWRVSYRISAYVFLCLAILMYLVLRNKPEDIRREAVKAAESVKEADSGNIKNSAGWEGFPMMRLLKMPAFYFTALFVFLSGFLNNPVYTAATAHMRDKGFDTAFIAAVMSSMFLVLALAKVIIGNLYDRLGLAVTLVVCMSANVVGILTLAFMQSNFGAFVFAFSIAIALPLETLMIPLIVSDMFGSASYKTLVGLFLGLATAGISVGNPVMNYGCDLLGSYTPVLLIYGGIAVVSTVMILACIARVRKYRAEYCNARSV